MSRSFSVGSMLMALAATMMFVFPVAAQQAALSKGSMAIGGQGSFNKQSDDDSEADITQLILTPNLQYFAATGFAIGGQVSFNHRAVGNIKFTSVDIGPSASYYLVQSGAVHPFVRASVQVGRATTRSTSVDSETTLFGYRASGGVLILLSEAVGLDLSAYYLGQYYRNGTDTDIDVLGIAVVFRHSSSDEGRVSHCCASDNKRLAPPRSA